MTEAAAWAAEGAPHGALVVARHQTAGRGRHGRTWADTPGQSLMLSLVLRPVLPPEHVALLGLATGLAVTDAAGAFEVEAQIKWPNDVLVGGRKLAGVLAEAAWSGAAPTVVVGVGVNVEQEAFGALDGRAVSLRQAAGRPIRRLDLLPPLLAHLAERLDQVERDPAGLVRAVEERMDGVGAPVTVSFPEADRPPVAGVLLGLAADGALRLATDARVQTFHAGEVTLRPPVLP